MLLSVQYLVWNLTHVKHLTQKLTDFDRSCTNKTRTTLISHCLNLVDDSCILLTCCFINAVLHILTLDWTVGWNLNNIELIDIPELTSLSRSSTRHTCKFVVHTEVVL